MAKRVLYNIVAVSKKTGAKICMTSSPVTASEAKTMLSKLTPHRGRHLELEPVHEDINSHDAPGRARNPAKRGAPRKGTANPRRKSQITGKKPTVRLVRRRQANSKAGYFPNPVDSEVGSDYRVFIYRAIDDVTKSRPGIARTTALNKQARVSYAQGLIQAGYMLRVLDKAETDDFLRLLKQSYQGQK